MQQGRTTTKLVAAATSFVCLKVRNGKTTSMGSNPVLDPFMALSTICLILTTFFSENNAGGELFHKPAPCAFCYVQGRSTVAMVPARTQCPDGWTTEYAGYIISEVSGHQRHRSNYICLDEAPEVAVGGVSLNRNQAVIYPVEVECGSLPCSVYTSGKELTCVVCTK